MPKPTNQRKVSQTALLRYLSTKYQIICENCHMPSDKLTVDHKKPLRDGGANDESNMRIICESCRKVLDGTDRPKKALR